MRRRLRDIRLLLSIAMLISCLTAKAGNWYFSSSTGDDTRSLSQAHDPSTPWCTLAKLNESMPGFLPGDSILFRRGDVFMGSIRLTCSGAIDRPVVLAAYGTGAMPVINGFHLVKQSGTVHNGIVVSTIRGIEGMINVVRLNGVTQAIGRYPDAGATDGGYLDIADVPGPGVIVPAISLPAKDWTGSELVIRKTHWVIDRHPVTSIVSNRISYGSLNDYIATKGTGFFLQNHPATLNRPGEWYYDVFRKELGMFTGKDKAPEIEVSAEPVLLSIENQTNLVIEGLLFTGANEYALRLESSHEVIIRNCRISCTGNTAVYVRGCAGLRLTGLNIDSSFNNACDVSGTNRLSIGGCYISNTGIIAGSGGSGSGSYEALLLSGDEQEISGNIIRNTGYNAITFDGSRISILANQLDGFGFVKDDGAAIYTWNNRKPASLHADRLIEHNIILHGIGAAGGTNDQRAAMHGIYLDDESDHIVVRDNSIASCSQYGIYLHNANTVIIDSNLVFDNPSQFAIVHDELAGAVRAITVKNNLFVAKQPSQLAAMFRSSLDDLEQMGFFDGNLYINPFEQAAIIGISTYERSGEFGLEEWRKACGSDKHSAGSPLKIDPWKVTAKRGANLYTGGDFTDGLSNGYAWSASNEMKLEWIQGRLRLSSLKPASVAGKVSLIFGVGNIVAGKSYLLSFSIQGVAGQWVETYLRRSKSPYSDRSSRIKKQITGENSITGSNTITDGKSITSSLLTATGLPAETSVVIDLGRQAAPVYLDDLKLFEADVRYADPDDLFFFRTNYSPGPFNVALKGNYVDMYGKTHTGSISIKSFGSVLLLRK